MAEVASVKDNFRLSGRREESQREVREPLIEFREAGASAAGSGVGRRLLGTGIADEGVKCSDGMLKSTSGGLDDHR